MLPSIGGRSSKTAWPDPSQAILIEDEYLTQRIDECYSGDFDRENHPDRCLGCGNIEPGYLYCRRCGRRIKRKGKHPEFCFQEVNGTLQHQDSLARIVGDAERQQDGGVHEWVTAVLVAEPSDEEETTAVRVTAMKEPPLRTVGYVPQSEAAAIQKVLMQVYSEYGKSLACKALVQGGVARRDGSASSYVIRLLLPSPRDIPRAVKAALANL